MSELSLMIALRGPTVRERMEFGYRSHAEDAATIYKWNGANGLYALHNHDVIRLRREFVLLQSVNDYWFQGVERRLGAALGVRRSSSFKFPLSCGKFALTFHPQETLEAVEGAASYVSQKTATQVCQLFCESHRP